MHKVSIIIPAFNEEKNINRLLSSLRSLPIKNCEVIVVDDGSTDGTLKEASRFRRVEILHSKANQGKGHAIRLGVARASGKTIVTMDADNSHNPDDIPRLVSALEKRELGLVIGSRYLGGSADHTPPRAALNNMISIFASIMFGHRMTDVLNGFKAFRKEISKNLTSSGFEIEIELAARCLREGYEVGEIPAYENKRMHGQSKLSAIRDGQRILSRIIKECAEGGVHGPRKQ